MVFDEQPSLSLVSIAHVSYYGLTYIRFTPPSSKKKEKISSSKRLFGLVGPKKLFRRSKLCRGDMQGVLNWSWKEQ